MGCSWAFLSGVTAFRTDDYFLQTAILRHTRHALLQY